ncbi:hypothetical protein B0H16DRAFT_1210440, partial [Mycena metata]
RDCRGFEITFPEKKTAHMSYPVGLHAEYTLPWGYQFIDGFFFLRANSCAKLVWGDETACEPCSALASHRILQGILERIHHGAHEKSRLVFHPIGNLIDLNRR